MLGYEMVIKPEHSEQFLAKMFNRIDTKDYFWTLSQVDAFQVSATMATFNWEESDFYMLDDQKFRTAISVEDYSLDFLVLMGFDYPVSNVAHIQTYEDFVKSDCKLALACVDCYYFDFYAKDVSLLEKLYHNAYPYCEKVSGIEKESDINRTSFNVR